MSRSGFYRVGVCIVFLTVVSTCGSAFSWGKVFGEREDVQGEGEEVRMRTERVGEILGASKGENGVRESVVSGGGRKREMVERRVEESVEDGEVKKERYAAETQTGMGDGARRSVVERKEERKEEKKDGEGGYGTIKKEMEDIEKQVGPPSPAVESVEMRVDGDVGSGSGWRSGSLADGLADAIGGLMRVYKMVVKAEQGSLGETMHAEDGSGDSAQGGEQVVVEESGRESEMRNGTGRASASASGVGEGNGEGKQKSGMGRVVGSVLGIAVVGSVGVAGLAFRRRLDRSGQSEGPLYPPRGPCFV